MNTVDIIILICLVPMAIMGLIKGFTTQLAAVVGIVAGVWASFKFSSLVSSWLQPYLEVSPQVLNVISFAIILIGVIILLSLLGKALKGVLKVAMLGWLDKILGFVFGLCKGLLILGLLVMAFDALNSRFEFVGEDTLGASVLYPYIKEFTSTVFPYLKDLVAGSTEAAEAIV